MVLNICFYLFSAINKTPYSIFAFPMNVANSMVARLLLLIFSIYKAVVYVVHAGTVEYVKDLFIVYSFTVLHHIAVLQLFA